MLLLQPAIEEEKSERGAENETESSLEIERKKRKISFGKLKKVSTFADPNGGLLYEAKEVEPERIWQEKGKKISES